MILVLQVVKPVTGHQQATSHHRNRGFSDITDPGMQYPGQSHDYKTGVKKYGNTIIVSTISQSKNNGWDNE